MRPAIEWADNTPEWRRDLGDKRVCGLVFDGAFAKCRISLEVTGRNFRVVHVDRLDDASVLLRDDVVRALQEKVAELMALKAVTP